MAVMGMYCKAYTLDRLRAYAGWSERPGSLDIAPDDAADANSGEDNADASAASGDAKQSPAQAEYLFVQENFVVTNGVFKDEQIVFDAVTPEWEAFCRDVLEFEVPAYELKTFPSESPEDASTPIES
jgi:hypothetical protein